MVYRFFDKNKFAGGAVTCVWSETLARWDKSTVGKKIISNEQ